MGHYVMDSIIYLIYSEMLSFKREELKTKILKLDNEIIKNRTLLQEYQRRTMELKQIIARNRESAPGQSQRQVVAVTEDTARFLPPPTHLMTTEIQMSETN